MKTCFMFGHADTPDIFEKLVQVLESAYTDYGIRRFVVGSRGAFDREQAVKALSTLKQRHDDLEVLRLISYHPSLGRTETQDIPKVFDATYYPEGMERVPPAYCIRRANEHMVGEADLIVCYVCHPGNSRGLLELAERKKLLCFNLAGLP